MSEKIKVKEENKIKSPNNPSLMNERLMELTTENERLKSTVDRFKKDAETLQIDYSNEIAKTKIDYENKELQMKREIRDLQKQLEVRSVVERRSLERDKRRNIGDIYEEALKK